MEKIALSIIIVDYNSEKLILDCLNSIKKHPLPFPVEIIIVDNASSQDQAKEYEKIIPATRTLRLRRNTGFGGGNNVGVKMARGKYLLLLNPDTLIVDDSISKMLSFIQSHDEIGALTCLLYQEDQKTLQHDFFGNFQSIASITLRRYNDRKIDTKKEFFYTDIVTGAALMIKRDLFNQLGGFDEHFFMYLEDDDLCRRLVNLGLKNAVLTSAKIIHLEGQSSTNRQKKEFYYHSQNYYWAKHNGIFPTFLMKILRYPYKIWRLWRR